MVSSCSVKVGIDLVEVGRIERVFSGGTAFQEEVFTEQELGYSFRQRYPFRHVASRFAAKEAFFKALGTGLSGEMNWRDVEVKREASGKPVLRLSGKTARLAQDIGVRECTLSLSHTDEHAAAVVLLVVGL